MELGVDICFIDVSFVCCGCHWLTFQALYQDFVAVRAVDPSGLCRFSVREDNKLSV